MSSSGAPDAEDAVRMRSRLSDELYRWRWWLGLLVVGGGVYAAHTSAEVTVPRWARVLLLGAAGIGVIAYPYAVRLVNWLYSPNYPHILSIEADGNGVELWEVPPDDWRELEVEDGELFPLQAMVPLWEAVTYDPDEGRAEGTWRAGATPLELVVHQGEVRSVRGRFRDWAEEGLGARIQLSEHTFAATRELLIRFVGAFEEETYYSGEEVQEQAEAALEDFLSRQTDEPDRTGDDGGELEFGQFLESPEAVDGLEADGGAPDV